MSVGTKHTLAECALIKAVARQRRYIFAVPLSNYVHATPKARKDIGLGDIVCCHREGEGIRGVVDYIDVPHERISTRDDAMAIHQWKLMVQCKA